MPREPPRSPPLIRFLKYAGLWTIFLGGMYLHSIRNTPERVVMTADKRPMRSEWSKRRIEMLESVSKYREEGEDGDEGAQKLPTSK